MPCFSPRPSNAYPSPHSLNIQIPPLPLMARSDREAFTRRRTKHVHVRSESDSEGEELTTKGRKRKRLARACSACHVRAPLFRVVVE